MTATLVDSETGEVVERTIAGFRVHPVADEFPFIEGDAFEAFVADVKEHGQREPIVLDGEDRIIDGRNRARACELLDIVPTSRHYVGTDIVAFVVSENVHRRHLTDSQRAMIAARIATRTSGIRGQAGDITSLPPTLDEASALLAVGKSSVGKAKQVVRDGTPHLQAAAMDGSVPIATAARVAVTLSVTDQDAYVAEVRAGADPVKAAPPDLKQKAQKAKKRDGTTDAHPPTYGFRRKHAAQLDALVIALDGATAAFEGVTALDSSVNAEEATRITGDLSKQIRSLNRINSLIKELTP